MQSPWVSICLPTLNGERFLERLLPALVAQRTPSGEPALDCGALELLAVDSSSSDRSVELLRAHRAHVEVIPQAHFRHGATRNRIAQRARGEFLVFLSQDALPVAEDFVVQLVAGFEDARTAGIYARILPHPQDDLLTRRTVLAQPEAGQQHGCFELAGSDGLWSIPERQRMQLLTFNDVGSAIRASTFARIPFPDMVFGEDVAWAARALSAGWRLRFEPRAVVRHAHHYSPRQAFARYRVDASFRRQVLGQVVRPSLWSVARGISYEVGEDLRFLARERSAGRWKALAESPFLRGAQVLGQYLGAREGR